MSGATVGDYSMNATTTFAKIITVKTLKVSLILLLGLVAILYPSSTLAGDESSPLPNPGLTPLNRLYFIDQWSEAVYQFFTLGPEAKIRLQFSLIAERIAEMKVVVENKGVEASEVESIKNSIQQKLDLIAAIISKEQQRGRDTADLQFIAQAGLDNTKLVLSSVLRENNQQLHDEILDDFTSVDAAITDLEKQPSEDEQKGLSESPEQDKQEKDKDSPEAKKQNSLNISTPQLAASNSTITTSGGQPFTTPALTLTPTPTPIPSVYISEKNCSLYFVKDGNEVLITTDDYGICPGQPDFIKSGDNYGVTWAENRAGTETTQIYFKKIYLDGQPLTGDIKLTQAISGRWQPSIAWTGTEYGIAWSDLRDDVSNPSPDNWVYGNNSEIYFVRVDDGGGKLGNEARISYCTHFCEKAELYWRTAGYYDLSWVESVGGTLVPHSTKLDVSGNVIQ